MCFKYIGWFALALIFQSAVGVAEPDWSPKEALCQLKMAGVSAQSESPEQRIQKIWEKAQDNGKIRSRFFDEDDKRYKSEKYETSSGFKMVPDIDVLSTMIKNIAPLAKSKSADELGFSKKESKFFKAVRDEALRQAALAVSGKKVSYEDYINLNFYFVVAMTRKSEIAGNFKSIINSLFIAIDDNLIDSDMPRGKWDPELKALVEQAPRILLLPTFKRLNKNDFSALRPYPIYYLGLSVEPNEEDVNPSQISFFLHDVTHAVTTAKVDLASPALQASGGAALQWLKRRAAFKDEFESQLQQVSDKKLRRAIKETWFEIYHEEKDLAYSPKGIRKALKLYQPPEDLVFKSGALDGLKKSEQVPVARQAIAWLRRFSEL